MYENISPFNVSGWRAQIHSLRLRLFDIKLRAFPFGEAVKSLAGVAEIQQKPDGFFS